MSCDCPNCQRDNILNGTLKANCKKCSVILDVNSKFQIMPDKALVCDECVVKHYILCPTCKKYHDITSATPVQKIEEYGTITTINVCLDCFTRNYRECHDCHKYFNRYDIMAHGTNCYCKTCFNKSYQLCNFCGKVSIKTDIVHRIRSNNIACNACFAEYGPIETYEKKPTLEFHGIPPHYYGVELEVELKNAKKEQRGAKAQEVLNFFPKDFLVLKEDGSIRCGFEMCSQPATVEEHKRIWNPFFDKLPDNIHSFNTSNCGLHIHCSKKPLSLLTIAKIVVFVNDELNQLFVETIAGRKSNSYSCYEKKKYGTAVRSGNGDRSYRYDAVNIVNKDTIEFRIFKGTLKRESLYKALEFCDSLIRFCGMATNSISYCRKKDNFITFVAERQKQYPHLYAFICAKILNQKTKLTELYGYKVNTTEQTEQTTLTLI